MEGLVRFCMFFILTSIVFGQEGPIIETENGKIQGTVNKTRQLGQTYYAFLGIPYGTPPVRSLRFTDPVPAASWKDILQTNKEGPDCTPISGNGSEDCLYLNVYTPRISENLLPVMVWIHGGYFLEGSASYKAFGPDFLLEKDVVFVSMNYRLGVFGFLSTEDDAATGNYGLKDQILALQWVQKNIKNFGGDPKQVTLFGQSAGSVSVSYLVQSPLTEGLFQKAIQQSGVSLVPWSLAQYPKLTAQFLASRLQIFDTDSQKLVDKLRKVEMSQLLKESTSQLLMQTFLTNFLDGFVWGPSYKPHNQIVTNQSHQLLTEGKFNRVPIMVGVTTEESIAFDNIWKVLQLYSASYDLFPLLLCPSDMNANLTSRVECGLKIKKKYFKNKPLAVSKNNIFKFTSDDLFLKPILEYAKQVSKFTTTYLYQFSYKGMLGNPLRSSSSEGVGHSEDLRYLFQVSDSITNISDPDLLVRKRMVEMWTNFAKTGNPTPNKSEILTDIIWPNVDPSNVKYLDIGEELIVQSNLGGENMEFWNNLYTEYGNPPYGTY